MPTSQVSDVAISVPTTMIQQITSPLAHVHRVIIKHTQYSRVKTAADIRTRRQVIYESYYRISILNKVF